MKKTKKAKKGVTAKKAKTAKAGKKAGAKKRVAKAAPKAFAGGAVLGCCTLIGPGPAQQIEGITEEECRRLANKRGRNPSWWPGVCAERDR